MEYQLSDFHCCPKCCGFLVDEDTFVQGPDLWLKYIKCLNCGWRRETKAIPMRKKVIRK